MDRANRNLDGGGHKIIEASKHDFGRKAGNLLLRSYLFFRHHVFTRADDIDGSGIERVLDMHPVRFLDHPTLLRAKVLASRVYVRLAAGDPFALQSRVLAQLDEGMPSRTRSQSGDCLRLS